MEGVKVTVMWLFFVFSSHLKVCVPENQNGRRKVVGCGSDHARPDYSKIEPDPDPQCSISECFAIEYCFKMYTLSELLGAHGVNVTSLKRLDLMIHGVYREPVLSSQFFAGLKYLDNLRLVFSNIDESESNLITQDYFLEPLQKLRIVTFEHVELPPLPLHSVVEDAIFYDGESIGHVINILSGASQLKHLRLNDCNYLGDGYESSGWLYMNIFEYQGALVTLNLNSNNLKYIAHRPIFLEELEEFYLSENKLDEKDIVYKFFTPLVSYITFLPKLRVLDVSGNKEYDICYNFKLKMVAEHPNLRRLFLDRTASTIGCITREGLPKLDYLSLVGNTFTHISFQNLPDLNGPLTITFGGSSVPSVLLPQSFYARISNRSKTDTNKLQLRAVDMTSLDCDCANGYFIRALREGVIDGESVTCEGDQGKYRDLLQKNITTQFAQKVILSQTDMSKLECDKYNCPPCDCRRSWSDSSVTVNCTRSNIREMPRFPNETLRSLEVAQNKIMNLSEHDFPSTLEFVDLSNNNIFHISKETTSRIFYNKIHLRLSGNPIACDCDNYHFLKSLQEHSDQVENYDNLTCLNEGVQFLSEVNVSELCLKIRVIQASVVGGAAVLVLAIAALVIQHRYSRAIKIFVHARGWCGLCVKEDMIDVDKLYDVFVTFCHKDAAVVIDEVLPKLESLGYRTCVHIRDWTPGEFIPNQITRSVEASRRTMVFLSQNFLESMWAMVEFRAALSQAIEDGIPRVIMVLLHEIDDTAVQPDLRSFLRSNTYVQWGDPWFWDKIQYALPSRRAATQTSEAGVEEIEMRGTNSDNVPNANVETNEV